MYRCPNFCVVIMSSLLSCILLLTVFATALVLGDDSNLRAQVMQRLNTEPNQIAQVHVFDEEQLDGCRGPILKTEYPEMTCQSPPCFEESMISLKAHSWKTNGSPS